MIMITRAKPQTGLCQGLQKKPLERTLNFTPQFAQSRTLYGVRSTLYMMSALLGSIGHIKRYAKVSQNQMP